MDECDFSVLRPARLAHKWDGILAQPTAFIFEGLAAHALRTRDRTLRLLYGARRVLAVDGAFHLRKPVAIQEHRVVQAASWGWHSGQE